MERHSGLVRDAALVDRGHRNDRRVVPGVCTVGGSTRGQQASEVLDSHRIAADPFFNIPYAYGPLFLYGSLWWSRIVEGQTMNGIETVKNLDGFKTLPVTDVDKALFGHHIGFFQDWLKHPTNDAFWDQVNFNDRMKRFGPLPALHVSGWFDGDGIGTKRNYQAMASSGHKNQKLIYGPWSHAVNMSTKLGPLDFGPQSARDLDTLYLRWFDHWLKGTKNNIEKEPPVDAFLMGTNEWRTFSAWPPKEAKLTRWYFHSKGHANSDNSDGLLSTDAPSAPSRPTTIPMIRLIRSSRPV